MISSDDMLRILQGWRASAVKLSFSTGASTIGTLEDFSPDEITVISGGNKFLIPLAGTTFRKVPRNEVKIASMHENWSESLEIRLLAEHLFYCCGFQISPQRQKQRIELLLLTQDTLRP